jgi:hypothetical protein
MEELRAAAAILEAAVETAVEAAERAKGQQPSEHLVTSCYFAIYALLSAFLSVMQLISDHARLEWCTVLIAVVARLTHLAAHGTLLSAMPLRWSYS